MRTPPKVIQMVKTHIGSQGLDIQSKTGPGVWFAMDDSQAHYIPAEKVPNIVIGDAVQDILNMVEQCDFSRQCVVAFITNFGDAKDEQFVGIFDLI